ncbi:hypothetical protein DL765_000710 [Monosporascus sp. GIB2]|nr:hypothetical protein DL765_000710 [Monosporascus sp. GIB2]
MARSAPSAFDAQWNNHKREMLTIAAFYEDAFPLLEFIHIGRLYIKSLKPGHGRDLAVAGDTNKDHGYYNVLKREFGHQTWETRIAPKARSRHSGKRMRRTLVDTLLRGKE